MQNATDPYYGTVGPVDDGERCIANYQLTRSRALAFAAEQRVEDQRSRGIQDALRNIVRCVDVVMCDIRPRVEIIAVGTGRPFKPPWGAFS